MQFMASAARCLLDLPATDDLWQCQISQSVCATVCMCVFVCVCGTLNSSSSSAEPERVNKTPDNAAYSEISWQHASYAQYSSSIVKLLCGRRTRRTLRATVSHTNTHTHMRIQMAAWVAPADPNWSHSAMLSSSVRHHLMPLAVAHPVSRTSLASGDWAPRSIDAFPVAF